MVKKILLLGDSRLYEKSEAVQEEELAGLRPVIEDLHDTLMDFREKYHAGRAVAAPQIGVFKRILYMHVKGPVVFLNPELVFPDGEKMEVLDDCMSFPGLKVKVERYRRCVIRYKNEQWEECELSLEGDLAELIQHEYDHLDGILATMRAMDSKSFFMV